MIGSEIVRKLLISLLLVFLLPACVIAEESGLTLQAMSEVEQQRVLKNVALVAWTEEYAERPIKCFDVRADGMIALGFDRPRNGKYVAVLNPDGEFQYGYVFQCMGDFLVDWADDGLGIIWVRSDVFATFDEKGKCLSMYEFDMDSESNRHLNALRKTGRTTGGMTYALRNDHALSALSVSYGSLVCTDAQGHEVILHDASAGSLSGAVGVVAVIAFVVVCIAVAGRKSGAGRIDKRLNS